MCVARGSNDEIQWFSSFELAENAFWGALINYCRWATKHSRTYLEVIVFTASPCFESFKRFIKANAQSLNTENEGEMGSDLGGMCGAAADVRA